MRLSANVASLNGGGARRLTHTALGVKRKNERVGEELYAVAYDSGDEKWAANGGGGKAYQMIAIWMGLFQCKITFAWLG